MQEELRTTSPAQGGTACVHVVAATPDDETSQLPLAKFNQRRFLRPEQAGTRRMAMDAGTGAHTMMLLEVTVCSVASP